MPALHVLPTSCQLHSSTGPSPAAPCQVYEHLVFGGAQHVSLRSLPGMASRSVRLGSAGKTFSFTAWKVSRRATLSVLAALP